MPKNIRKRLIATCAMPSGDGTDNVTFDPDAFLTPILLLDKYIFESLRLWEFPHLIRLFGVDGVLALLRSNAISIHCDMMGIGENRAKGAPVNRHSIVAYFVQREGDKGTVHMAMQSVRRIEGLSRLQQKKLTESIARILVSPLAESELSVIRTQISGDIRSDPESVAVAASIILSKNLGKNIGPSDFVLNTHEIASGEFETETNISKLFNLDEEAVHSIVSEALQAVGNLSLRFAYMKQYEVLSGFRVEESEVLLHKFRTVSDLFSSGEQNRFHRVMAIAGLPDFSKVGAGFPIQKLLDLREREECIDFRNWLDKVDGLSDAEIAATLRGFRQWIEAKIHSLPVKILTFVLGSGLGMIHPIAGLAIGAIDGFVVDKILKESGPHAFLNRYYRSLFN